MPAAARTSVRASIGRQLSRVSLPRLQSSSARVVVDEGERIVQIISEKLRNGEDWKAALKPEKDEAVTSRNVRACVSREEPGPRHPL